MDNKYIIVVFLIFGLTLYSQEEWQLKKDANDIQIFVRNSPDSNFAEFKATTILNTAIENVLLELLTAPKYNKTAIKSGVSYYLKQKNENEHVFYVKKELPWPLKNRDIVTLLKIHKISDTKIKLTLEAAPEEVALTKNTLRIKAVVGYWLLEKQNTSTKVTQQLFLNPEGSVPPFVSNALLIKGPYQTFLNLKKLERRNS